MRPIGYVRKVDRLGRITLPKKAREDLGFVENVPIEIFATDKGFFVRKYAPGVGAPRNAKIEAVEI